MEAWYYGYTAEDQMFVQGKLPNDDVRLVEVVQASVPCQATEKFIQHQHPCLSDKNTRSYLSYLFFNTYSSRNNYSGR